LQGSIDISRNNLNSKPVGNTIKTMVDVQTSAKARDQATDPMVGEKSTDPKMRD
jgi:hypothetical protein